jgi:hypothetical protein
MAFQEATGCIIIGMGQAGGFMEVPEERSMRNMPAGFISTIWAHAGDDTTARISAIFLKDRALLRRNTEKAIRPQMDADKTNRG